MKDDLCKMINDIYPLYLEGDVSDETKLIIDEHMAQCETCSKLKNEYSVSCLPNLEVVVENTESENSFKKVVRKIRRLAFKIIAAALVVVIVASGVGYFIGTYNRKSIKDPITYVKTEEDVIKYYYDKIPGLERGQREGCYENIAQKVELPDNLGKISFNKIWYTKDNVYVFYDITPGDSIRLMNEVQVGGNIIWNDNKGMSTNSWMGGMRAGEWVSYNGSYYNAICFSNTKESWEPSDVAAIVKVSLALTININSRVGQSVNAKVPEVSFPVIYNPSMDKTYTVDINKEIKINFDTEIVYKQLVMEPQESYLLINFKNKYGNEPALLKGVLSTDKGETSNLCLSPEKIEGITGEYRIKIDAIDKLPSDVKITLNEVRFITDKGLKFEIDAKKYHGNFKEVGQVNKEEINKKIGSVGDNLDFLLKELSWSEEDFWFTISYNMENLTGFAVSNWSNKLNSWAEEENYRQRLAEEDKVLNRRTPNLVKITNEKGEVATMDDYGMGGGTMGTMSMAMKMNFVDKSDTIYIEITNVVETITGLWGTN